MGWHYEYLSGVAGGKVNANSSCPKRKNDKPHKLDLFFMIPFCTKCNADIKDYTINKNTKWVKRKS